MSANERSGCAAQAELIGGLVAIISTAAEAVMCIDPAPTMRWTKATLSSVSATDEAANEISLGGLRQALSIIFRRERRACRYIDARTGVRIR